MSEKVRHVLGISGGKDSAALAIYMHKHYPEIDMEYYTCDTGKELEATYQLIDRLEIFLGKKIIQLRAAEGSTEDPFDHFFKVYGGYLPSSNARWCTKKLKLEPFEAFVGTDPVVSYVGIRADENREGYISKKSNIQSIFPFRKNIWSEDVILKALKNSNIPALEEAYAFLFPKTDVRTFDIIRQPISVRFMVQQKLELLLDSGIKAFNHAVFQLLKTTGYPLATEASFSLVNNEEMLVRENIFDLLRNSGVGVPEYYQEKHFRVDGTDGKYARSRSGCYFCFFQQKIEWVWLYEQQPEWFQKAMQYEDEKAGFTWNQNESLLQLINPARIEEIKKEYLASMERKNKKIKSSNLVDILNDAEEEGCAACFI